jgi:hypothetical protein
MRRLLILTIFFKHCIKILQTPRFGDEETESRIRPEKENTFALIRTRALRYGIYTLYFVSCQSAEYRYRCLKLATGH